MSTTTETFYEKEYWTFDKKGRGYCSTSSLEDAIRGHFLDMQAKEPLGPIANAKIITRKVTRTTHIEESEESLWEDR